MRMAPPALLERATLRYAKTPLVRWKFSVCLGDSCGARDFIAWRRKSRPLRPHRLASSATGGASALRLPTSLAQSASIRLLSGSISWKSTGGKKKHHPFGWCFFLCSQYKNATNLVKNATVKKVLFLHFVQAII